MAQSQQNPLATWTSRESYLLALVCLVVGLLAGYLLRGSSPAVPIASAPAASPQSAPSGEAPTALTSQQLDQMAAPMLAALKADPNSHEALIQLGNLYYDHKVWAPAIDYYNRALKLQPNDINVRTDLGTALWYSGMPGQAVKEYEKSLALNPIHANTLFNMGVVKMDGLKDAPGAIAAWQKLLDTNPQYPEKQRVLDMIAKAKSGQP